MENSRYKFRAWDEETETMVYSDREHDGNWFSFDDKHRFKAWSVMMGAGSLHEPPEPESYELSPIMQYTGLKDKDGVEMDWWEGDILEDENGYRFRIDYLGDVGRYGFLALADLPIENYYFPLYDYQLDELKKIGNFHQHPELLEKQEN